MIKEDQTKDHFTCKMTRSRVLVHYWQLLQLLDIVLYWLCPCSTMMIYGKSWLNNV
ncbi:unnamed protein product [Arabidopsis halleri]